MYCSPILNEIPMQIPSYEVRNFKVFFGNQYLPDARWSDFHDLGHGYGKDGNHVFFMGHIIENVQPFSFQIIDNMYAKDDQHIFQCGRIVGDLQPYCFPASTNSNDESTYMQPVYTDAHMCLPVGGIPTQMPLYEIRDFKVFFGGQYLPDARWIDFTYLGQGYGKDVHHVFFMGHIVEDAHSYSFEVLNKGYAKDKNHVFQNGRIVEGLKPIGFQAS